MIGGTIGLRGRYNEELLKLLQLRLIPYLTSLNHSLDSRGQNLLERIVVLILMGVAEIFEGNPGRNCVSQYARERQPHGGDRRCA